jgi:cytosine/creatinine deaminase
VTTRAASCFGLTDYGLAEGQAAHVVVYDADTVMDVVRKMPARTAVISHGRVVARTTPARSEVMIGGRSEVIDFQP